MLKKSFGKVAATIALAAGSFEAFALAVAVVIVWAMAGPMFGFNDTWLLVINTGATIVTFLMVFVIQHTQNADTAALHIKLDELIRASATANNELLNLEEMDLEHLEKVRSRYAELARRASQLTKKSDLHMPAPDE
ncbi:MAG: low affinity iron permease family protein [Stenotrophomonas nitritireducens]|uniref:low affinity iron permease family protein n=1 Tax=Stenotrophomonas TaxID=40323 RepID=UPI001AD21850|nr:MULTISPECIES: low affinity iron permease family protein [Stenotrophomonas]MBN8768982.1 low affinity iron permease family protein [Stenotrophomonas sp.]MBN8793020.1 low affinity iron permease family protein [Stenotrophomonas nitritireducens]